MSRFALAFAAAGLFAATAPLCAQEAAGSAPHAQVPARPAASGEDDLHAIRRLLEQQTRQIDALAREVAQLTQHLGGGERRLPADAPPRDGEPAPAPPESTGPVGEPGGASPAPPHEGAEVPKGEAVAVPPGGAKHTVSKGETLTSIAKQYNIPVADLQKANQIRDEHKLQIGQILNIPPPKPPQPPTDKKEKHNG